MISGREPRMLKLGVMKSVYDYVCGYECRDIALCEAAV